MMEKREPREIEPVESSFHFIMCAYSMYAASHFPCYVNMLVTPSCFALQYGQNILHLNITLIARVHKVHIQCSTRRDKNCHILTFCEFSQACNELCTHETYHHDPQPLPVNLITIT